MRETLNFGGYAIYGHTMYRFWKYMENTSNHIQTLKWYILSPTDFRSTHHNKGSLKIPPTHGLRAGRWKWSSARPAKACASAATNLGIAKLVCQRVIHHLPLKKMLFIRGRRMLPFPRIPSHTPHGASVKHNTNLTNNAPKKHSNWNMMKYAYRVYPGTRSAQTDYAIRGSGSMTWTKMQRKHQNPGVGGEGGKGTGIPQPKRSP